MATVASTPLVEAWALLREVMFGERHRFLARAAELDLHPGQAAALMQMEPAKELPMNELAANLHCDNSNVTGLVDRLEARGLVERRAYEQDRRVKHVVLTAAGVEMRERLRAALSEAPETLKRLSPGDQRALRDIVRRAVDG